LTASIAATTNKATLQNRRQKPQGSAEVESPFSTLRIAIRFYQTTNPPPAEKSYQQQNDAGTEHDLHIPTHGFSLSLRKRRFTITFAIARGRGRLTAAATVATTTTTAAQRHLSIQTATARVRGQDAMLRKIRRRRNPEFAALPNDRRRS
jgi:hypothetical protein